MIFIVGVHAIFAPRVASETWGRSSTHICSTSAILLGNEVVLVDDYVLNLIRYDLWPLPYDGKIPLPSRNSMS